MTRRKIGLTFLSNYKEWAGGVIYILNIIHALQLLDDSQKPELYVYHKKDSPIKDIRAINYPYIRFFELDLKLSKWQKLINYGAIFLIRRSTLVKDLPDIIYPDFNLISYGRKTFHWIPDFQQYYLPHMFSEADIKNQKKHHLQISQKGGVIVFSSEDAMNDFRKFYPDHKCELRLLRFASSISSDNTMNVKLLMQKFGLIQPYFMAPNQFWKHKNHKVILEAVRLLKEKDLHFHIGFTGSQQDHRNKEYFSELLKYIETYNLSTHVKFLGFIDRREQLKLMDNAIAIIQPSLFEGWSTVVEDAKALNQFIILSDLRVHQEQVKNNCHFFNPYSAAELAAIIEQSLRYPPQKTNINYMDNVKAFAADFLKAVS